MKNMKNQDIDIEGYLKNEMTLDEISSFEAEVWSDKDLQRSLVEHTQIHASFDQIRRENLRTRFGELDAKFGATTKVRSIGWSTALKWAASISVLFIVGYLAFWDSKMAPNELYAQYFKPYPNVVDPVTRDGGVSDEAFTQYESGNFEEALEMFEALLLKDPSDFTNNFYYGLTAMMLDKNTIAQASLGTIVNSDSKFKFQANWYLALMHLRENDLPKARINLEVLVEEKTSWADEASEILKQL